jgi:peroxiredoxin
MPGVGRRFLSARLRASAAIAVMAICGVTTAYAAAGLEKAPKLGEKAPPFVLAALDGQRITLASELVRGPVVLVLLRGWPGYQCPFCTRQFADFLDHARDLEATGARVVWVYPGRADQVQRRASEFTANRALPLNFRVAIDPDYAFTNAYGLRWDQPNETAYPATLVIDRDGVVRFVQVSSDHDHRALATDVIGALKALSR